MNKSPVISLIAMNLEGRDFIHHSEHTSIYLIYQ